MSTPSTETSAAKTPDTQSTLSNSVTASSDAGAPSDETNAITPAAASADSATPAENGASAPVEAVPAADNGETVVVHSDGQADTAVNAPPQDASATPVDASLEIDHRRAKQLLDRSMLLAERGDFAGAILAARQAVVLTPTSPTGHSMLGLLHERAGDLEKAIASYEKVLQLAPQSTAERDTVERLKATLTQENASVIFHFNDNELFEEPEALPVPPVPAVKTPVITPAAPVAAADARRSSAPTVAAAAAPSIPTSPVIATPRRGASGPPVIAPLPLDYPTKRAPILQSLSARPSFYFKAVPLVATTALGMLFMAWAQGVSQSKRIAELQVVAPPSSVEVLVPRIGPAPSGEPAAVQPTTVTNNPTPPPPGTPTGNDIFGRGQTGAAPVARVVVSPPAPSRNTARTGAASSGGTTTAPLPPSSTGPLIPQPVTPSGAASGSSNGSPPFAGLAPIRPRSDNAPAVRPVAPSGAPPQVVPAPAAPVASGDGGGNSRGGGLFNPGSQPRGVIRVDSMRPAGATASRPANVVRRAEASAAAAAAQGNTGRAINSMSDSIQRLPTGYAYQRRAMAFLEQTDYSRAADDFQSAIAAYNDQINHNQDVDDARNGIRTCQSGLRMAINNIRR